MATDGLRGHSQIFEEIKRVEAQSETLSTQLRQGFDWGGDDADKAADLVERAKVMALRRYLRQKCRQLAHAEELLAQGLASVCEECGQPIDPARLKTLAGVTRCIKCQRRIEQRGRRPQSCAA